MFKKRTVKSESVKRKPVAELPVADEPTEPNIKSNERKKLKTEARTEHKPESKPKQHKPSRQDDHKSKNELDTEDGAAVDVSNKPHNETKGPLKPVAANVRTTTITDFEPDVCKDFAQTGYCGYGDTCKFLHIRGESKNKKPVTKEWETAATRQSKPQPQPSIPFKCVLCKEDYKHPIKTTCEHYFCKQCFMSRAKTKLACYICHKDTNGIGYPVPRDELEALINNNA